jgi:hypothetical protein
MSLNPNEIEFDCSVIETVFDDLIEMVLCDSDEIASWLYCGRNWVEMEFY